MNRADNNYIGIAGTSILTEPFFAHYGNINDVNSQSLVAFDKNGTLLAAGINKDLVGDNFFGDHVQQFINHNTILNNLTRNLLDGKPGSAVYKYGGREWLTTGYPIFVNAKPLYFIEVATPTTQIYSMADNVLSIERVKIFALFSGASTVAIVALIIVLKKWNVILRKEVKRRTKELEESYDEMKQYLETVLEEMKRKKYI
jgi:hypothetical protein